MLTLTRAQMDELQSIDRQSFIERVSAKLRTRWPEHTGELTSEALMALVRGGIDEAAGYNLLDEAEVEVYCDFMVQFGRDFPGGPTFSWAHQVLSDPSLSGMEKLESIEIRMLSVAPHGAAVS